MNFDLVMGDKTGYFHMKDCQKLFIEYDEFSVLRSSPPANLIIDNGSEIWASADFKIIGTASVAFEVCSTLASIYQIQYFYNKHRYSKEYFGHKDKTANQNEIY